MSDLLTLERKIDKLARSIQDLKREELVSEKDAAAFLNVTVRWLQQLVGKGVVSPSAYQINVAGKRVYLKSKLVREN